MNKRFPELAMKGVENGEIGGKLETFSVFLFYVGEVYHFQFNFPITHRQFNFPVCK